MPVNKSAISRYRVIAELLNGSASGHPISIDRMRRAIADKAMQDVSISTIEKDIHALRYDKALGILAPITAADGGGFFLNNTINIIHLNPFETTITMKLKTYNTLNVPTGGGSKASTINIGPSGEFSLSPAAVELLGVSVGHRVELHQDEQRPQDWYVSHSEKGEGFELRASRDSKVLRFRSSGLRAIVLKSLNKQPDKTGGLKLPLCTSEFEGTYWSIITAALNRN